jgi:hypothetical protein
MIATSRDKAEGPKVDNMELHRQMYERRLRLLKEHKDDDSGADGANEMPQNKKEKEKEK